ncbi:PREDICTED: receptor-like protein kinase At3g21340 isoform X2 [Tarenaya hassleriana]|uniref:receptor-like protein kinase At3g21340 isoform X2 n=1 Tax=Tarenaya hassleriana TaxID=28532 RepID=UPI00053C2128|nr:PREDICTED: receptor-like protein kinase At3g21340 isoform X2 [Tarenaya hassleriana]
MESRRVVLYVLIGVFAFVCIVQAQDQQGFISLDCGLSPSLSPYDEPSTGLTYMTDENFVQSGKSGRIEKDLEATFFKQYYNLRYFPDGIRNCYNLNVTQNGNYLIRATFVYGNYDGLNNYPRFDLHLGPNIWATVDLNGKPNGTFEEIVHTARSNTLQVCLVKTGTTAPMISALELRPSINGSYTTQSGSLKMFFRVYFSNAGGMIRYPSDIHDRRWFKYFQNDWTQLTTALNVNTSKTRLDLPQGILTTPATPTNASAPLSITWQLDNPTDQLYFYLYFADIQTLLANDTREFNVTWNGDTVYGPYSPPKLALDYIYSTSPFTCDKGSCTLNLVRTPRSTLPPLLNSMEAYVVVEFPQLETNKDDVAAINIIQTTYGLNRISWQGDPCVPKLFLWEGLTCSTSDNFTAPSIISLNLSSSGLTGSIAPAIQNLTQLQQLDLSNNNLTGGVPEFLANMKSLLIINLSGNNLSGSVPESLLNRQNNGLKLELQGNPNLLCRSISCGNAVNEGHHKKNVIVPVVASVASVAILIVALALFFVLKKKKASSVGVQSTLPSTGTPVARSPQSSQPSIVTKNKRFAYSEVQAMTNNFQRILGKGGFGVVYHGYVNGTEQVAVKMLSHSSSQGYKQFKAEVELLMRVHHKNLVSLVGYCDDGDNLALIYEYMANGDLKEHLSGKRDASALSWGTRLKIVAEAAQGLEYLHNGCKPPMVHRDVKTTNILLNEHLQAKLADFGLSRSFPTEGETHVSTVVAGTPGYLDPEYYRTNWLTEKSDVYSFGIVLLEIITNRPVIDQTRERPHITEWVGLMLTRGDINKIMDPKLYGDYDTNSIWRVVELAMACVNPSSSNRPNMSQVVIELNECLASENSRVGTSRDMDSKGSIEVSMNFGTEVIPTAR